MVIKEEEEYEVERIINKRKIQEKAKYLVWWKGCTAEEDTWESKENLKNVMELVKEFEKEYCREEEEEVRWQEVNEDRKTFSRELPERYMAKLLYGWGNKKYNQEYWKKNPFSRYSRNPFLKRMEEEKDEYKGGKIEEWNEEEDEED